MSRTKARERRDTKKGMSFFDIPFCHFGHREGIPVSHSYPFLVSHKMRITEFMLRVAAQSASAGAMVLTANPQHKSMHIIRTM